MSQEIRWIALDQKVIAVAMKGEIDDWAAYIGAVPGKDHTQEWQEIARRGTKLPRKVAEILFPEFAEKYRWRE